MQVGGRRIGSRRRHQAHRRQPGRGHGRRSTSPTRRCTRARPRRSARPRCRASPTATSRSSPGPEQRAQARRRRDARRSTDDHAGRPRPALQHARPENAQGRCSRSSRARRRSTTARARQANEAAEVLQPGAVDLAPARQRARPRPAGAARTSSSTAAGASRRSPGARATTSPTWSATPTRRRRRSAPRTSRSTRRSALLPGTLRQANTTFVNLRATLDDLDALVDASKPAHQAPGAVLRAAAPAAARRAADDPRPAHARSAARARTTTSSTCCASMPQLPAVATPAFQHAITALQQDARRCSSSSGPTRRTSIGWFRDFGQGAANYDANGHYARIQPIFNAFQFTDNPAGGTLTRDAAVAAPRRPADRQRSRRCPGAATQPPPTARRPYADAEPARDCDPSLVLPGP